MTHFSPLRYPGGKARLAPQIKALIAQNGLSDGCYVEPFSGGFGLGLDLLLRGHVSKVHINDLAPSIYCFWKSLLDETDAFCELIRSVDLNVDEWRKQKKIFTTGCIDAPLELGFAAFYLNRTNRSGVLNGGPIGGVNQNGSYKIDARFNRENLISRIEKISRMKSRITVTSYDAIELLKNFKFKTDKTLFYFDPPYYVQGGNLYYNSYKSTDHENLLKAIRKHLRGRHWIVSYDDHPEIRKIYTRSNSVDYLLNYSLREHKSGREVMFFSNTLKTKTLDFKRGDNFAVSPHT